MNFTREWFFDLEKKLREAGLDSDEKSFDEIRETLTNPPRLSPDEFARACAYVVLAGGFSQKTAKIIHAKVMDYLENAKNINDSLRESCINDLLVIFNNRNKINAIVKIWENREAYRDNYYKLSNLDSKLSYLQSLPHIGKITANHLARNLGENVVKYDIWIQRLGVMFVNAPLQSKIDNGNLDAQVRAACDEMFAHLERETNLPRGYIDVVLWKACQNGLIKIRDS